MDRSGDRDRREVGRVDPGSNVGAPVTGLGLVDVDRVVDMRAFDRLPKKIRDALNYALGTIPAEVVLDAYYTHGMKHALREIEETNDLIRADTPDFG